MSQLKGPHRLFQCFVFQLSISSVNFEGFLSRMRNTREGGYSNTIIHKRNKTGVSNINCVNPCGFFWVCSKRSTTTGPAKKHGGEDLEQVTRFDHLLMATLRSRTSQI